MSSLFNLPGERRLENLLPKKTDRARNVLALMFAFCFANSAPAAPSSVPNGRSLVERSLAAGERNEEQLREYVSRTRSDSKQLNSDGSTKTEEVKTFDDVLVGGFHVRTLVAKNDKPLASADRQREEARTAKLVAERKRESAAGREKRIAEAKEKREKERRFTRELLDAFDYEVIGEEVINGRKAWILNAAPHPGYKPKELKAQLFPHLRGKLWIDQEDLLWVKAQATAVDEFSIGFSLVGKLNPGAKLSFEQSRLPDGTWVVERTTIKATGRVAIVKQFSIESLNTSQNFRKVPPGLRITDGKEDY